MADPWREIAATMKTTIETVSDRGVVIAGHTGGIATWTQFLDTFSSVIGGSKVVAGFRIIEPPGEPAIATTGEVLSGGVIQDVLRFNIEGFRMIGEDPVTTQAAFRDVVWEVKKKLDALYRFTVTDGTVERVDSWPSNQARLMPMLWNAGAAHSPRRRGSSAPKP
jgi:hypothetical protein